MVPIVTPADRSRALSVMVTTSPHSPEVRAFTIPNGSRLPKNGRQIYLAHTYER